MKIDRVVLRELHIPLVHFFETSFGKTMRRRIILVEVHAEGAVGWGEVTATEWPFYNEEWTDTAWLALSDFIVPEVAGKNIESATQVADLSSHIRGHRMARGGLEAALWHLEACLLDVPLWKHIGGIRTEIACGVSIGIQNSIKDLLHLVEREVAAGYQRIKLKIKPGWDVDVVCQVRKQFPDIQLMVDANSAYNLAHTEHLQQLDEFELMMIEQPLAHDEIIDHATLQSMLKTPICLDESIKSAHQARQAIQMDAARIINIKLGRVGGFSEALKVHKACRSLGTPVWCGGMLESGIGRAHNIALSTLDGFSLPGDVAASERYWKQDVIDPPVVVTECGTIHVPDVAGLGYQVDLDFIKSMTVREQILR